MMPDKFYIPISREQQHNALASLRRQLENLDYYRRHGVSNNQAFRFSLTSIYHSDRVARGIHLVRKIKNSDHTFFDLFLKSLC